MTDRYTLRATLPLLLAASLAAGHCSAAAVDACRLELVGTWTNAEALPVGGAPRESLHLLRFSADGWATILEGPRDVPAERYEVLADVRYELMPARIEFSVRRGNALFPRGTVSWQIGSHGDDRFDVLTAHGEQGASASWRRVQTRRYFLTFAARLEESDAAPTTALVMWTVLDGQKTKLEALGAYGAETDASEGVRFGRVPYAVARAFETQPEGDSSVMLRVELNEAEYRRTHIVFEAWNALIGAGYIADDRPYRETAEVLRGAVLTANRCGLRIKASEADLAVPDEGTDEAVVRRRVLETILEIEKTNRRVHVGNEAFPAGWRPPPVD